jgi:hypothetical protein
MSRFLTSIRGLAPPSKYTVLTARWKHSADVVRVGLVLAPPRLCTGWFPYWSTRYELCSVSPRDEYGGTDRFR